MHKRISIRRPSRVFQRTTDGKIKCLRQIDQYPVIAGNCGLSGFPASDVSLFNKLSSNIQSTSKFAALMQHVHMLAAEKNRNKGKTIQQLIDECMPAYIQLPAETVRFYEWAATQGVKFDNPSTTDEKLDEKPDEKPVEPVKPSE